MNKIANRPNQLITLILASVVSAFAQSATTAQAIPTDALMREPAIDQVIAHACKKPLVLLGEDGHHGSGKTLRIKSLLVQRLVEECGFTAVFFESQVYDFIALDHAVERKTATREELADAIGGLWSLAAESDSLVDYLYPAMMTRRVKLAGLDPQLGGATQYFSQTQLPGILTTYLPNNADLGVFSATQCQQELQRHTAWQYDDSHPYDDNAKQQLRDCIGQIQTNIALLPVSNQTIEDAFMTANFARYLQFSTASNRAQRDRGMYDNLLWHLAKLPANSKVIVWCATVHAVKLASIDTRPRTMGHYVGQKFGKNAFVLGFSALTGEYLAGRKAVRLSKAPTTTLEALAFAEHNSAGELRYLNHAQLISNPMAKARAIDLSQLQAGPWAQLIDGLLVLREEHVPHIVREAKPQQRKY
jgi:erythromycin esterase-like protein